MDILLQPTTMLAARRASHGHASSSQKRLHIVPRAQSYAFGEYTEGRPDLTGLKYDTSSDLKENKWAIEENWSGAPVAKKEQAGAESGAKSLKINRDLLLYNARQKRQEAFRLTNYSDQLRCYQDAEAALKKCLSLDPTDARAYVTLGKILQLQKRFDEARNLYEDAMAVTGGQNAHVWQSWAVLESKAGKVAQARKYFNAAILVDPSHAASWHGWGMLEKREGNFTTARDLWVKGVQKTGEAPSPHLYQSLAVLAGEMGFIEEARAWFREGTSSIRGAHSHALWHAWALLEERYGELKIVRYLYKKGLEASPRSRYIHLAWAMYEKSQDEVENARRLLSRGHSLNRRDAAILQAWAVLESEQGDIARARELFQAATKYDPQMTHAWQAWGVLELREQNFKKARHLFQSGIWSSRRSHDACQVWQAWATLESRAGNIGLARSMFNCAVKADPSSSTAWESWIAMEEALSEDNRVIFLRKAWQKGQGAPVLPARFIRPEDVTMKEERSVLDAVVSTVNEWVKTFESKRGIAKRPQPSYLRAAKDEQGMQQRQVETLGVDEMMKYNDRELDLPEVPAKYYPRATEQGQGDVSDNGEGVERKEGRERGG